jgi:hypothetical protein
MATGKELIKGALKLISVIDAGSEPSDSEYDDGLVTLNDMLNQWTIEGLLNVSTDDITHPLVSGTTSYTIGSGATIDTVRPTEINNAFVRDTEIDYYLEVISKKDYDKITDKTIPGTPRFLFYDPDFATGTVYIFPVPTAGYTLHMTVPQRVPVLATIDDELSLPLEYAPAIKYNLAIMVAPQYQAQTAPETAAAAAQYKKNIKNLNARPPARLNSKPFTSRLGIFDDFEISSGRIR